MTPSSDLIRAHIRVEHTGTPLVAHFFPFGAYSLPSNSASLAYHYLSALLSRFPSPTSLAAVEGCSVITGTRGPWGRTQLTTHPIPLQMVSSRTRDQGSLRLSQVKSY